MQPPDRKNNDEEITDFFFFVLLFKLAQITFCSNLKYFQEYDELPIFSRWYLHITFLLPYYAYLMILL